MTKKKGPGRPPELGNGSGTYKQVTVKLTKADHALLQRLSKSADASVSEVLRLAVHVLLKEVRIVSKKVKEH